MGWGWLRPSTAGGQGRGVNGVLRKLVARSGGLVTRRAAEQAVPEWILQRACRKGELVRVLPEVFVAAHLFDDPSPSTPTLSRLDPALRNRAAYAWAEGRAALSHLTAPDVWGLRRQPSGDLVHLSAPFGGGLRSRPGHRAGPGGFLAVLPSAERRAPMIRAVNDRLTTPARLAAALRGASNVPDRAALGTLVTRLAEGCRSPVGDLGTRAGVHRPRNAGVPAAEADHGRATHHVPEPVRRGGTGQHRTRRGHHPRRPQPTRDRPAPRRPVGHPRHPGGPLRPPPPVPRARPGTPGTLAILASRR